MAEMDVLIQKYDTSYPNNASSHELINYGQYSPQ